MARIAHLPSATEQTEQTELARPPARARLGRATRCSGSACSRPSSAIGCSVSVCVTEPSGSAEHARLVCSPDGLQFLAYLTTSILYRNVLKNCIRYNVTP